MSRYTAEIEALQRELAELKRPRSAKEIAEIYVKEDNRRYGILNFENDVEEIDVYFDAKQMGEYTINAITGCEYQSVTLVDLITGNETDLLASSYTFKSMTNESTARFKLRIERDKENENYCFFWT